MDEVGKHVPEKMLAHAHSSEISFGRKALSMLVALSLGLE